MTVEERRRRRFSEGFRQEQVKLIEGGEDYCTRGLRNVPGEMGQCKEVAFEVWQEGVARQDFDMQRKGT